jgi:hypothetical protein
VPSFSGVCLTSGFFLVVRFIYLDDFFVIFLRLSRCYYDSILPLAINSPLKPRAADCNLRPHAGRCYLGHTLLSLIENVVVCTVPLCWLYLDSFRVALADLVAGWVSALASFIAEHCACFLCPRGLQVLLLLVHDQSRTSLYLKLRSLSAVWRRRIVSKD